MIKLDGVKILHLAYFLFREGGKYHDNESLQKQDLAKELPIGAISTIEDTIGILDDY